MTTVASGLGQPTNVALDRQGGVWVTSAGNSTARTDGVWYVARARARPLHVVSGLYSALGLTWYRGELYVSHVVPYRTTAPRHTGEVTAFSGFDGQRFRRRRTVVRGIPTGLHRVDSIVAGPDRRLYLGVGSQTDAQRPRRRLSASIISFETSGRDLRVEATGLRNPYGLAFMPGTSTLLVSDEGRDDLGLKRPPEELNAVDVSKGPRSYGFPGCFDQGGSACRGSVGPIARLPPHSAVGGVAISAGFDKSGPSAFVAEFGSSFDAQPTGGDVVRVPLVALAAQGTAKPKRFLTGLRRQDPLGLAAGPNGALYLTLWSSGSVLRIAPPNLGRRSLDAYLDSTKREAGIWASLTVIMRDVLRVATGALLTPAQGR